MNTLRLSLCALATAGLMAGCASNVPLDDGKNVPVETRTPTPAGGSGSGTSQSQVATVDLDKNSANANAPRIVYFDYDSYVVKDEFRPVIEQNAKALAANRSKRVSVEGHTDERGGREYNLALGQKRAEAVAKSLALLGASDAQVEAVSFGKERPAVDGHDEAAYAKNRRVEIKDK